MIETGEIFWKKTMKKHNKISAEKILRKVEVKFKNMLETNRDNYAQNVSNEAFDAMMLIDLRLKMSDFRVHQSFRCCKESYKYIFNKKPSSTTREKKTDDDRKTRKQVTTGTHFVA